MSAVEDAIPLPSIYYNKIAGNYYVSDEREQWIPVNEAGVKRKLRIRGYSAAIPDGALVSALDEALDAIQLSQHIDYAGPLAGYPAGWYEMNGDYILVTNSPRLIEPVEGEFPVLRSILEGMFTHGGCDQLPYVFGWLKVAVMALRERQHQPGQVLAMAGPVKSGKSLFQGVVTELLGGRASDPSLFMTGGTTFNSEIFGAEHLTIEDEAESKDYRARRLFGAKIKSMVANRKHKCHGKYKAGLTLEPFWRVTISLNDDPERILVLPPVDADIEDKIMLLKVAHREMPMPTETSAEQQEFWNTIRAELPAFVDYLIKWEIPLALRSSRFGITHFHHPDVLEALKRTAPEIALLELINTELFPGDGEAQWIGTASQLMDRLMQPQSSARVGASSLLRSQSACGAYLGRLERELPERVSRKIIHGTAEWTIAAPPEWRKTVASGVPPWIKK